MLFRRFHFKTWLKLGFIGWLAGGASGSFNLNVPSFPRGGSGESGGLPGGLADAGKNAAEIVRSFLQHYWPLIVLMGVLILALGLLMIYLSCRFRFILFDAILEKDAQIRRGWARYGRPAQRYFAFTICFLLLSTAALILIVGLPLWHAYKRGVFHSENLSAILGVLASLILGVLAFVIVSAIIGSLAGDFGVPILALDDSTLGGAWSVLRRMIAAEPWAFAGYLGMKLLLTIGAGIITAVAGIFIFVILLIPGIILVVIGAIIFKLAGPVAGIILAVIGVLLALALALLISMLLTAPVSVFFTSYALSFLGGRYPKLGALLWPPPPAPIAPPATSPPPPAPPFVAPA